MQIFDWPTQDQDLALAEEILEKHRLLSDDDDDDLGILELRIHHGEPISLQWADWVAELTECLAERYEPEYSEQAIRKVLTHYLIGEETIH